MAKLNKIILIVTVLIFTVISLGSCSNNSTTLAFCGSPSISGYSDIKINISIKKKKSEYSLYYKLGNSHSSSKTYGDVSITKFNKDNSDNYKWAMKEEININSYDYVYENSDYTILRDVDKEGLNSIIRFKFDDVFYTCYLKSKEIEKFNHKPLGNRSVYLCDYHAAKGEDMYQQYMEVRPFIEIIDHDTLILYNHTHQESIECTYYIWEDNTIKLFNNKDYTAVNVMVFIDDSKKVITLMDGKHVERYKLYTDEFEQDLFNLDYII